jgi:hypothetical protein
LGLILQATAALSNVIIERGEIGGVLNFIARKCVPDRAVPVAAIVSWPVR